MSRPYRDHDAGVLRALLQDRAIGEVQRDRIRGELERRGELSATLTSSTSNPSAAPGSTQVGKMNQTETRHSRRLEADPDVVSWLYESVKVRSGKERAWLTPDFFVVYADGSLGFDEVKGGYVREDARAKFQAGALLHQWARWRLWQYVKGEWTLVHDYPRAADAA